MSIRDNDVSKPAEFALAGHLSVDADTRYPKAALQTSIQGRERLVLAKAVVCRARVNVSNPSRD